MDTERKEIFETIVNKIMTGISVNLQRLYVVIDLLKVPDNVNYSKVKRYLRSVNIKISRKMLYYYLKENFLPGGDRTKKINDVLNFTQEQIIYYILIDMFKPILPMDKVKVFINVMIKPMIDDFGLESTYQALCEMKSYMAEG